jgi:hypothetical protein
MDMLLLGLGFGIGAVAIPYLIHKYGISDCIKPFTELCKFIYKYLPTKENKAKIYSNEFQNCGLDDNYQYAIIRFFEELREKFLNISTDKPFEKYEDILEFESKYTPYNKNDTNGICWLHRCKLVFETDKVSSLFNEVIGYLQDEHYLNIDFNSYKELFLPKLNMLIDEFHKREHLIHNIL